MSEHFYEFENKMLFQFYYGHKNNNYSIHSIVLVINYVYNDITIGYDILLFFFNFGNKWVEIHGVILKMLSGFLRLIL